MQLTSANKAYRKARCKYIILAFVGILSTLVIIWFSLITGNYTTSVREVFTNLTDPDSNKQIFAIIIYSRLPRLFASLFVGAALSVAGLVYQDIFLNKMASPDLLGVSSGSSCGAAIAILLGLGFGATGVASFVGGLIAVFSTILISKLFSNSNSGSVSLILSGIVIGGVMNSLLGFFKYISNDAQLATITFWLLGGFDKVTYAQLIIVLPVIIVGIIILLLLRWKILMLRHGDMDAKSHGVNVSVIRNTVIIASTLITAAAVCISGTIGWVGLAIPNLVRILIDEDNKYLMPLAIIYGMAFMATCDLLARTLTLSEIPVGILTGSLGAIIFILVLIVRRVKHARPDHRY